MTISTTTDFKGNERFKLVRRLGQGSFGVVYEVFDHKRNSPVALKTLLRSDGPALYHLKQEFRTLADVTHPNLVMLYELMSENYGWFFTMELVKGVDLRRWVRGDLPVQQDLNLDTTSGTRGGTATLVPHATLTLRDDGSDTVDLPSSSYRERLDPPVAPARYDRLRNTFLQLAEGVFALHQANILHRDLKPSNVLVTHEGRVVILDFGIARDLSFRENPETIHIMGSPPFMAPEQMLGDDIAPPADWYSVGTMLYEALTGRLPFHGTMRQMLRAKQSAPPSPRDLLPGTPEDLNHLCVSLLQTDPGARPTGEHVLRQLQLSRISSRVSEAPPDDRAVLVGRERHLGALRNAYEYVKAGHTVVARVHGRSGMGKTALVRHFIRTVVRDEGDVVVFAGRCYERESVAYKALDSLIDALSQYLKALPEEHVMRVLPRDLLALTRLFPVLRELEAMAGGRQRSIDIPDAQELRKRAFQALREVLARISDQRPLLLFIDDLHWGDLDSAEFLGELPRPPNEPSMLLIVSYRSEELETSPLLGRLLPSWAASGGAIDCREIEVGELGGEDARELARTLLGKLRPEQAEDVESLAREAGGSPFFLRELARHAQRGRGPKTSLDEVIWSRVAQLPAESRRLMECIAVAGQPVELEVAQAACDLHAEEHPASEYLRAGRLTRMRSTSGRKLVEPYHDRIREAVVARLPVPDLQSRHLRLARAWEASGRFDPETLANHYLEGGDPTQAGIHAQHAADKAVESLAFDRAARLYRMVLNLRSKMDRTAERSLQTKLANALSDAGRGVEAAEMYLAAAEGAGETQAAEMRRRAAQQFLIAGDIDKGKAVLKAVVKSIGMDFAETPTGALLSLLFRRIQLSLRGLKFRERAVSELSEKELLRIDTCWSAAIGLGMVDTIRGADFQARHTLLALAAGEPYRIVRALAMEIGYSTVGGGRSEKRTRKLLATAQGIADRIGHPHALGLVMLERGSADNLTGRFPTGAKACETALGILHEQCTGVTWELDTGTIFLLHSLWWMGEWRELARRSPGLLNDAQQRGDLYFVTYMRTRSLYVGYLCEDEPARAAEEQRHAMDSWSQTGFHVQHYWDMFVRGEIDLYAGKPEDAWERLQNSWKAFRRSMLTRCQGLLIESHQLRARVALAMSRSVERSRFLKQAEHDARVIEKENMPYATAQALLIRAGLASLRNQPPADLLRDAEAGFRAVSMGLYAVVAQRQRGKVLAGADGRDLVESAEDWMRQQGIRNPGAICAMLAPGQWET